MIKSILDSDSYKFSMAQAVLEHYPAVRVKYRFFNRNKNHKFDERFLGRLDFAIRNMAQLKLQDYEYEFLKRKVPYFKPAFLEWLRNYRFDPSEVHASVKDGELSIEIEGLWCRTILWEVDLLALVSETFYSTYHMDERIELEWIDEITSRKGAALTEAGCVFSEFGTRRRRSFQFQERVNRVLFSQFYGKGFVGTSNVYFSMLNDAAPKGTVAHEWTSAISALESLRHANYYSMQKWVETYNTELGTVLPDTFGLDPFFKNFNRRFAMLHDSIRHDSGCPFKFTDRVIDHYKSLSIDPNSKTIIYSNALDVSTTLDIQKYREGEIKKAYGIGTHFSNHPPYGCHEPLNIVIKLWEVEGIPVVKLSEDASKSIGDPDALRVARWTFFGQPLD